MNFPIFLSTAFSGISFIVNFYFCAYLCLGVSAVGELCFLLSEMQQELSTWEKVST